jgi:FAD:protein FMN transferase
MKIRYIIFTAILLLICCRPEPKAPHLLVIDGQTMGTVYSAKIVSSNLLENNLDSLYLKRGIDSLLNRINQQMSTYQQNSELSRFNQYRGKGWFAVSPELCQVVEKSVQISRISGGAFDVTVGPLVNLWGFGPEEREELIPGENEIQERKKLVGYQKIQVQFSPPALKKELPEMYCDLSAIAKGYGVDKVGEYLEKCGIRNYLVDIGGEIRTRGKNHQGQEWKIGVSTPDDHYEIQKVLVLENLSVATSGDYRNYFEKDGVRYSHTIDPQTGRPITHHLASVTVIHDSCMVADGLATAIDVLGPEKGLRLADKMGLAVFLIIREDTSFIEKMTPQFEKVLNSIQNK